MRRIAAVTEPAFPGFQPDDEGMPLAFACAGLELVPVPWGTAIDPSEFDMALIRTPWDYFERPGEFLAWVEALDVPVHNEPSVLRWNHHKGYLIEIEEAGLVALPPTVMYGEGARPEDGMAVCAALGCDRFVLKPAVSGGAFRTRVLGRDDVIDWTAEDKGEMLAQAYVEEIERSGEWSVMVFGGEISHTIRKTPKAGDFRVQSDHGGAVHAEATPPELAEVATRLVQAVPRLVEGASPVTYARVDMVWDGASQPILMELELIEPELFFRCDDDAAGRLAAVLAAR